MRLTDVMTIWLTWSINHECDAVALSDKILNRRGNAMNKVIHPNNYNRGGVFLGATYDAVIGNPYGVDYDAGGMDPGLKRAVKVIKTTNVRNPNSDCPDEAHCVPVGAVCSKIIQEDLILDTRDYVNSFSSSLTFEATGMSPEAVTHTGGLGLGFDRVTDILETKERSIVIKKTVCVLGESSFKSDRGIAELELDEYFVASLCRLIYSHSDADLQRFINRWGTHVIVGLTVGTKYYEHKEVDKIELMRSLHTSYSGNVFYQASWFRLLTAGVTATAKKVATEYINQFHSFSSSVNFSSGTEEFPEPVNIRLRSLQSLVDVRYLPLSVVQDCPGLQTAKRMMELKGIVEYGLKNYPSWIGAEKNLTSLLREVPAVKIWPTGYYGFLKTNDGCPGEWASGKRFHDTANGANPDNTWSTGFANRTSSQVWPNDLSLNFCMKDTEDPSVPRTEWPAGSYCFFKSKKSPCPYGFNVGSYFNDDDDFFNKNAKEGVLPDGSYGRNTEYKFCCRDDNSPFQPVFLPIEQDFILMPKRGVCQEVYGMISELHYIHFDCENHWYSRCKFSGDAPYGLTFEDGDHQVFFCAYSKH